MTYRNDHDAALARIESLEQENAHLERENASLRDRSPPPPRHEDVPHLRVSSRHDYSSLSRVVVWIIVALISLLVTAARGTSR